MMKTILCSRLVAFLLMAVAVTSTANADTIDLGAGFDAGAQNSFFKIEDNSGFDLTTDIPHPHLDIKTDLNSII